MCVHIFFNESKWRNCWESEITRLLLSIKWRITENFLLSKESKFSIIFLLFFSLKNCNKRLIVKINKWTKKFRRDIRMRDVIASRNRKGTHTFIITVNSTEVCSKSFDNNLEIVWRQRLTGQMNLEICSDSTFYAINDYASYYLHSPYDRDLQQIKESRQNP